MSGDDGAEREARPSKERDEPQADAARQGTRPLSPEAKRALEEAAARRAAQAPKSGPKEIGGRAGPDPARFGDWEKKGIISDF